MRQRSVAVSAALVILVVGSFSAGAQEQAPLSEKSKACITCHNLVSPGIVFDWQNSRHAQTTPSRAMRQDPISRRISVGSVSEIDAKDSAVACYECHSLRTDQHKDSFLRITLPG